MVIFVVALAVLVLAFGGTTAKARGDIKGSWSKDGPGRIADRLQSRNRTILGVIAAILIGLAVLEAIIPNFHFLMEDFQYAIGSEPMGLTTLGTGGGISWGLYLAVLVASLLGVLIGTKSACSAFGTTNGVRTGQLV